MEFKATVSRSAQETTIAQRIKLRNFPLDPLHQLTPKLFKVWVLKTNPLRAARNNKNYTDTSVCASVRVSMLAC